MCYNTCDATTSHSVPYTSTTRQVESLYFFFSFEKDLIIENASQFSKYARGDLDITQDM